MTKQQRQYSEAKLVSSAGGTGQMDIHLQKKNNVDTDLTSFTKINSWWIIDLWVKIKSLEDNITENLDDLRYGDAFSDTRPNV